MQVEQEEPRTKNNEKFTHEENKLLLTLLGITLGSVIACYNVDFEINSVEINSGFAHSCTKIQLMQ